MSDLSEELKLAFKSEFKKFRDSINEPVKRARVDKVLKDLALVVAPALASPNERVRTQAKKDAKILKTELIALTVITEIEAAERINAGISKAISVLTKALVAAI